MTEEDQGTPEFRVLWLNCILAVLGTMGLFVAAWGIFANR